ncbi:hypothetical protein JYU34_014856 [Plutella xylostella]|uniref:Uncharacterized protein n=1 Tax=Plutella xylostella TaxID=51655 RepID=A0ABQ7Q5Z0_PLUXY|nr:hypothetical protein JYU34_014856 [Plutella xylostella]
MATSPAKYSGRSRSCWWRARRRYRCGPCSRERRTPGPSTNTSRRTECASLRWRAARRRARRATGGRTASTDTSTPSHPAQALNPSSLSATRARCARCAWSGLPNDYTGCPAGARGRGRGARGACTAATCAAVDDSRTTRTISRIRMT